MIDKKSESIFWGILIIILGILFLSNNLGWTDLGIWELATTYWPLILIYIGARNIIIFFAKKK